ncbi:hypothetical protein [Pelagibius marinus]|uniref:hypothetical protein n=1 Tax=Pelagibius marinus TaxID=2762760 RepID=UPI00187301A2|nr:hypothetical protein [Pelagibius marinus]
MATLPLYPFITEQLNRWGDIPLGALFDKAGLESFIDQVLLCIPFTLFLSHWLQFLAGGASSRVTGAIWTERDLGVMVYCPLFILLPLLIFLNSLWEHYEALSAEPGFLLSTMYFIGYSAEWLIYLGVFAPYLFALAVNLLLLSPSGPAFAAAAAGERLGLFAAWRLTRGLTFRLLWLWLLLYAGTGVVGGLLSSAIESAYSNGLEAGFDPSFGLIPPDNTFAWVAVWQVVQLPRTFFVFVAAALIASVCLRAYHGENPATSSAQQQIMERFE